MGYRNISTQNNKRRGGDPLLGTIIITENMPLGQRARVIGLFRKHEEKCKGKKGENGRDQ